MKVKVRFAPSPTGYLNLGGARSALFNWLFAQKSAGEFLLRIEDTDQARKVDGAEQQIAETLAWLGIEPAQKPVRQSDRLDLYRKYASELTEKGVLYPCWCSPERLTELRQKAQANKVAFKYDRHCLESPGDPKEPHVLRFKVPEGPKLVTWDDAVKGKIEVPIDSQDDFVAIKSDGYPTYHFANVVDDHDMEISHVLRADEWLASTPKHILLYEAFGWEKPVFAHLPGVLGAGGGKKLSKRYGAKSVLEYHDEGYLPEAIINYLALLGWNPGEGSTKEIFSSGELIKEFSLERIQASPAVFDDERLDWMNGLYIRAISIDELSKEAEGFWPKEAKHSPAEYKKQILELLQERLKFLAEIEPLSYFFFADPQPAAELNRTYLDNAIAAISESDFSAGDLEQKLRALAEKLGVKTGDLFGEIRLAVTGGKVAPPLFDTLAVLGRETTLRRLKAALALTSKL